MTGAPGKPANGESPGIPSLSGHPTVVRYGIGVVESLPASFPQGEAVLVVASPGTRNRLAGLLAELEKPCTLSFAEDVPTETTLDAVSRLLEQARERHRRSPCSHVLAIGGGATMDSAKALAIGIRCDTPLRQILDQPDAYADRCLPLICVPTTSGSGSDVTPYATIWDTSSGRKRSLSHARLLPIASWIDPRLMCSAPPGVTATSGLDVLSHALEAVWSRNHSYETDVLAAVSAQLVLENLAAAVASPHDLEARAAMARAALAGGLAISRTQSAAAHATSYAMTLRYGVTHGHACAVSLPWLLRRQSQTHPQRFTFLTNAVGLSDADSLADAVESLIAACGLPTRLRELGIPQDGLPELARLAMESDRMRNTLLVLTTAELHQQLLAVW